jgi:Xaa-Pro aminopeptidase
MLTIPNCRQRLEAFCASLAAERIELAVITNYRHVYYLTGHLRETELPQVLLVSAEGESTLITDSQPSECAAGDVKVYESYSINWPVSFAGICEKVANAILDACGRFRGGVRRIAIERERTSALLLEPVRAFWPGADYFDAGPMLARLRRRKHVDEIDLIKQCVACIETGYAAARAVIRPGATELDVFKEMHGEIVRAAGYNLKFDGDFACGVRAINGGGTPLAREIQPDDLYIIDIYPSFRGYHADLCRTFAVSPPTDRQMKAWEIARRALDIAERMIRPGVPARGVWEQVCGYVDSFDFVRGSFNHHAGHGIGLDPQEPPWLIPGSDHVFEAGDVVAVEPGCYSEALRGGVRLERNYVVTAGGVENLSEFPLEL